MEERIPLSVELKEFFARNLREAGNLCLELANKVDTIESKEELESSLIQNMSQAVARLFFALKSVMGAQSNWAYEKIFFSAVKVTESFDIEELKIEIKEHVVMNIGGHGLSQAESLNFASIIRNCFSNPDRKKHPQFLKKKGYSDSNFHRQNENPEYWLNLLKPELIKQFNDSKIILTDTSNFKSNEDKQPYLQSIKTQSWHGPYKWDSGNSFRFVSINQSGDNIYFVYIYLNLNSPPTQHLSLYYYKNSFRIAPPHFFKF